MERATYDFNLEQIAPLRRAKCNSERNTPAHSFDEYVDKLNDGLEIWFRTYKKSYQDSVFLELNTNMFSPGFHLDIWKLTLMLYYGANFLEGANFSPAAAAGF